MPADSLVIVLAGGVGERLFPLTKERAKPAVYFGGPYRIIDFTLSNCVNSGFRRIYIATQYKSLSLSRHIRMGWKVFAEELGRPRKDLVNPLPALAGELGVREIRISLEAGGWEREAEAELREMVVIEPRCRIGSLHAIRADLPILLSSGTDTVITGTPFADVLAKPYGVERVEQLLDKHLPRAAAS